MGIMKQTLKKYRVYYNADMKKTGFFGGWIDLLAYSEIEVRRKFYKIKDKKIFQIYDVQLFF